MTEPSAALQDVADRILTVLDQLIAAARDVRSAARRPLDAPRVMSLIDRAGRFRLPELPSPTNDRAAADPALPALRQETERALKRLVHSLRARMAGLGYVRGGNNLFSSHANSLEQHLRDTERVFDKWRRVYRANTPRPADTPAETVSAPDAIAQITEQSAADAGTETTP